MRGEPLSGNDGTHLPDIKPYSPVSSLERGAFDAESARFEVGEVARVVGMSPTFVRKVCGSGDAIGAQGVLALLDQDSFSETIVPRSRVLSYLLHRRENLSKRSVEVKEDLTLVLTDAVEYLDRLKPGSVQCVVTSTPYWGMRVYKDSYQKHWADGEESAFGHEQTPEGFLRHTSQVLSSLYDVLAEDGSIWWNVMDSYNTRTQVRGNAAEALRAMQGKDERGWKDYDVRRYSAGHAYLKDGEQCMVPSRIAERASRMGFYVKSVVTWAKTSSLPEPQPSRVSRNLEYVLHLTKQRTPKFNKQAYESTPAELGGRNDGNESLKLSDVWMLSTSNGKDGHGAQFPAALPGRCIALTTDPGDLVLDPFVGAGNAGIAAMRLGRRFLGLDVSPSYLATARERLSPVEGHQTALM